MLTEGREGFKKVPGGPRIRSGRVSAQTEPWDPIRDIFRVNFQDVISRNIIDEQRRFF